MEEKSIDLIKINPQIKEFFGNNQKNDMSILVNKSKMDIIADCFSREFKKTIITVMKMNVNKINGMVKINEKDEFKAFLIKKLRENNTGTSEISGIQYLNRIILICLDILALQYISRIKQ